MVQSGRLGCRGAGGREGWEVRGVLRRSSMGGVKGVVTGPWGTPVGVQPDPRGLLSESATGYDDST